MYSVWLKPGLKQMIIFGLNESTPPSYCYKHEPRETGRGGGRYCRNNI